MLTNVKKGGIIVYRKGGKRTMKTTKKELLKYAKQVNAIDITTYSFEKTKDLLDSIVKKEVAYSVGTYGINAYLFKDEKDTYYLISSRNTNLFMVM